MPAADSNTPQTGPLLEVRDLSVDFGAGAAAVHAVRKVSFTIAAGETLALVGESGSGKSVTALSVLQLLPYPMARHPGGSIKFRGEELIDAPADALRAVRGDRIAMIFQEPMTSLNPLHTIERQVSETLLLHKGLTRDAARARTLDLLTQVGIPEAAKRLDAYPHQLSGGQRQRVMIAMALANEPDLLIADEPTTALDVTIQAQILKLLKTLQKRYGMALLFITHDLGIVRKMADRVCVMSKGEIVEQGPVAQVFDQPSHTYTKHLLSAEPKGRPLAGAPDAPVVLSAGDVKVHFPIKRGVLRRTVGHIKAVDGVSSERRAGHTVGVVGESGSGKSVTMMSLIRLLPSPPATIGPGQVLLDGQDLLQMGDEALRRVRGPRVGFVFQDPMTSLNPVFNVGSQIMEPLRKHMGMTKAQARQRAQELLDLVGIPDAARRLKDYPHQFSGGMRQRVMIAIALACDPDVLIADEPTTALDVTIQAQIIDLVKRLQAQLGMGVIWITHDLGVIAGIAQRVMVMYAGQIVEQGPVKEVFSRPQHPYTRALLKTVPALTGARAERLQVIEGQPPILMQAPAACSFRDRCTQAFDRCARENPARRAVDGRPLDQGHDVACHWEAPDA